MRGVRPLPPDRLAPLVAAPSPSGVATLLDFHMTKRIAFIHATPVSMGPISRSVEEFWPEIESLNLLDDSLSPDRARSPELTSHLAERIGGLADYAANAGAEGILYTCSAFGPAIEVVARRMAIPVLKPNEAMFENAIAIGGRVAMLYTFGPAGRSMGLEFGQQAKAAGSSATLDSILVEGAIAASNGGDEATHNRLVAETAAGLSGYSAIILGHFSTARARKDVEARVSVPVLSSPDAAIHKLKSILER